MKRFLRTTKQAFESVQDKSQYNNSLVLIEDQKCIWSNGVYYGLPSDVNWGDIKNNPIVTNGDGFKYLSDDGTYRELDVPTLAPMTLTVNHPNNGSYSYVYDGSQDPNIVIDLTNLSISQTIDVTFESDFAPDLYVVGQGNQFRLVGDGHILSNNEWEEIQTTLTSINFCSNDEINNLF